MTRNASSNVIIITGPSGAGKTTAINALEDIGFETIDNIPIELIDRVMAGPDLVRPLALGIDVRTRGFSAPNLLKAIDSWKKSNISADINLMYLDCQNEVLEQRFNETRRRHPLSDNDNLKKAIIKEELIIGDLTKKANFLVDTSKLSPNELKLQLIKFFDAKTQKGISITIQSFSYKRSMPVGMDMMFDCRFLRNPHWDKKIRTNTGLDDVVSDFIEMDRNWIPFYNKTIDLLMFLLPKYRQEGKSYFSIGFGCSGGQHRSVFVSQSIARGLNEKGWVVHVDHRELKKFVKDSADSKRV
ncbi:MAG: RNase adapter RapZ [Pseudomonadota bacterium]|nr:RNase adapter RapZ [Pseudomonadota bacterium]